MKDWQPQVKDANEIELELVHEYGAGLVSSKTYVHCSEGDTLFIRQNNFDHSDHIDRIALGRHELYNIIFNFMSDIEILKIAERKISHSMK